MKKKSIGKLGEDLATIYLNRMGYKILARNFRCRVGEVDIIAKDVEEIVFIEVKTRTNNIYGEPSEAVDYIKKENIIKTANYYLYINKLYNKSIRFDVIEVFLSNKFHINHIKQIEL